MKKFIIYVVLVLVTAFAAYFIYNGVLSSRYDDTVIPYIQEVLPAISKWNPDIVQEYMAPEVLRTVSSEDLESLMGALSKIGALQNIGQISFKGKTEIDDDQLDKRPLITYEVEAQYSTGDAKITISLVDRGTGYDLYHFNFQSSALAP